MLELGDLEMDDSDSKPEPKKKKAPEPEGLDLGGLDLGDLELADIKDTSADSTPTIKPAGDLDLGGLDLGDLELANDAKEETPPLKKSAPSGEIEFGELELTIPDEELTKSPVELKPEPAAPAEALDIGDVNLSIIEEGPAPAAEAAPEIHLDLGEVELTAEESGPAPAPEIHLDFGQPEVASAPAAPKPAKPKTPPPPRRATGSGAALEKIQQRLYDLEERKKGAEQSKTKKEEYFVFGLEKRRFAVEYRHVAVVNRKHFVAPLFQSPDHLAGIFPHEGGILTLVNLDRLMDLPYSPTRGIVVVLETADLKLGILADTIDTMVALDPPVELEPIRSSDRAPKYTDGILPADEGSIYHLAVEQLMKSEAVWM